MGLVHWMALSLSAVVGQASPWPQVVWIDLAGVPAQAQMAARREAEEVLGRVGVSPRWRVGHAHELRQPGELLVVVLREDRAAQGEGRPRVLGACLARPSAGRVWIYLDNVAWAMGLSRAPSLAGDDAVRMGRALGRIVAHEVIHAVAPYVQHARSGIMQARLERRDLLANRLDVDRETVRGLRRALMPLRASSVPPRS